MSNTIKIKCENCLDVSEYSYIDFYYLVSRMNTLSKLCKFCEHWIWLALNDR